MKSKFKKANANWAIVTLASIFLAALIFLTGCSNLNNPYNSPSSNQGQTEDKTGNQNNTNNNSNSIVYKNTVYGFNFTLPSSWQGYSIITENWDGSDPASGKITETGPMLSIRHPQWNSEKPRQDIPIMIFTIDQWESLKQGDFHIGAAPIDPAKLGSNNLYVFALPARYNYSFPTGYEEVEDILENKPLQTTNLDNHDSTTVILLNMMQAAKQGKVINCEFPIKTTDPWGYKITPNIRLG